MILRGKVVDVTSDMLELVERLVDVLGIESTGLKSKQILCVRHFGKIEIIQRRCG